MIEQIADFFDLGFLLFAIVVFAFLIILIITQAKKNNKKFDDSMDIARESQALVRERLKEAKESNKLLTEILEALKK